MVISGTKIQNLSFNPKKNALLGVYHFDDIKHDQIDEDSFGEMFLYSCQSAEISQGNLRVVSKVIKELFFFFSVSYMCGMPSDFSFPDTKLHGRNQKNFIFNPHIGKPFSIVILSVTNFIA